MGVLPLHTSRKKFTYIGKIILFQYIHKKIVDGKTGIQPLTSGSSYFLRQYHFANASYSLFFLFDRAS